MFESSQDVFYLTISLCVAVFTGFLVWIMYYVAQISRQSNEMITDFRIKMEELDASVKELKEKVSNSIDSISMISDQVASVLEVVKNFSGGDKKRKKRTRRKLSSDDE